MKRRVPKRKIFRPRNGEEWICSKCGRKIEALPFLPDPKRPVYHRECLPPKEER